MTAPRSTAAELVRALDVASVPLYVLDGRRRIVFINAACRDWLGERAASAIGHEGRYHTIADASGEVPVADLLCPPPEVFAGTRMTVQLAIHAADDGQPVNSRVEFIPLPGSGDESAAVLAVVSVEARAAAELESRAGECPAELHAQLQRLLAARRGRFGFDRLVGDSPQLERVRSQSQLAATSMAATLIVGPAGSGRRRLAYSIHEARPEAARGLLVPLACPLLTSELLVAGVQALKRGRLTGGTERAATLLLEDVDSLPAELQPTLAGLLRPGDQQVRIVSTACLALVDLVDLGQFSRELAIGLSTITIELPPLAERPEDIPLVAQRLLEEINAVGSKQLSGFSAETLDWLAGYDWPGDLAELSAMVAEAHARAEGSLVQVRDLPDRLRLAADASRYARVPDETIVLEKFLGQIERELIERALARARGNKAKAARLLGMTRPRLYRRLVQLGLEEQVIFEETTDE